MTSVQREARWATEKLASARLSTDAVDAVAATREQTREVCGMCANLHHAP